MPNAQAAWAEDQHDHAGGSATARALFKSPGVRLGLLIAPAEQGDGPSRSALTYEQGELAVEKIKRDVDDFDRALSDSIAETILKLGVSGQVLDKAPDNLPLSPACRAPNLGVVYDFKEIAFEFDGALVMARACVTVCVQSGPAAGPKSNPNFSKYWTRFIWVRRLDHSEAERPLDAGDLKRFDERCGMIAKATFKRLHTPYEKILREVTGDSELKVAEAGPHFEAVTVEADQDDFHTLYAAVSRHAPLPAEYENRATEDLFALARHYFPSQEAGGIAHGVDPLVDVIPYESTELYRGVFLRKVEDGFAQFIGLGREPRGADKLRPNQPSKSPANVVGAGLISAVASQF